MDNLNEEIDVVLERTLFEAQIDSILKESMSEASPPRPSGTGNKEFTSKLPRFKISSAHYLPRIKQLLGSDGERHGLDDEAIAYILKVFVKNRQEHDNNRAANSDNLTASKFTIKEGNQWRQSSVWAQLATDADSPDSLRSYLNPEDDDLAEYRFKKIVYIGKELNFWPYYALQNFKLKELSDWGTVETDTDTDTPPGTDTDTDTEAAEGYQRKIRPLVDEAADILATRMVWQAVKDGTLNSEYYGVQQINKMARVIQKHFLFTRALKLAESTDSPTTAPISAGAPTDPEKLPTQKIQVALEKAEEALERLKEYDKEGMLRKIAGIAETDEISPDKALEQIKIVKALIMKKVFKDSLYENNLLKEDKLVEINIDFSELRNKRLDESFLAMFGGWIEHILKSMFGSYSIPVNIRGSQREVESFARAIGGEKNYIEAAKRYGLDHPTTYKNRAKLDVAVKGFEKDTGLKWPFK